MSEKERQGEGHEASPKKSPQSGGQEKPSLFKMRDLLENKKGKREEAEKEEAPAACDDAETTTPDGSQDDGERIGEQLAQLPPLEAQKAMRERPSLLADAKWYDKLFFSWTFKVITVSDFKIQPSNHH